MGREPVDVSCGRANRAVSREGRKVGWAGTQGRLLAAPQEVLGGLCGA